MVVLEREKVVQNLELRMKKERRPGVYLELNQWDDSERNTRDVYKFCSCGHREKVVSNVYRGQFEVDNRTEAEPDTLLVCPVCKNDRFYQPGNDRLTYVIFEETDMFVKLRLGGYRYHLSNSHLIKGAVGKFEERMDDFKPVAYSIRYKVVTNKKTRMTYLYDAQRKTLRNISKWGNVGDAESFLQEALEHELFHEEIMEWYKFFCRHIPDYALKEWNVKPAGEERNRIPMDKLFLLYSYPYHIHFGGYTLFEPRNQKERSLAREAGGKLDLYRIKLPKATKRIVKEMEMRPASYDFLEILSMMENKNLLLNTITSTPKKEDCNYRMMRYSDGQYVYILDAYRYPQHFKKRFIRLMFGSQEIFDQKLSIGGIDSLRLIRDSLMMFNFTEEHLKKLEPEASKLFYEEHLKPLRGRKIKVVHDGLMRAQQFCVEKDQEIPQAKIDKKRFNRSYGGLDFRVAERTYDLIGVGTDMSICVGSYRNWVVNGEVSIVSVFDKKNKPLLCIEIKNETIVQVKKKYNQRLSHSSQEDTDLIDAFKRWIENTGLTVNTNDFSLNPGETRLDESLWL